MAIRPATSAMLAKFGIGAAAALVGVGVGLLVTGGGSAPAAGIAMAWIDQPLDGAEYPNAPIMITAHATDPDGVANVTLSIDGTVILTSTIAGTPTLATIETEWTPTATGQHELNVVATDRGGGSGTAAQSRFTIADVSVPTTTPTVTATSSTTTTIDATTSTSSTTTSSSTTSTTSTTTSTSTSVAPATSVAITTVPPPTPRPTTPTTRPTIPPTTPPTTTPATTPPTTTPPTTTPPTAPPTTTATTSTIPATTTTTTPTCVPGVPVPTSPFDGEVLLASSPILTWVHRGCGPDTFTVQVADNALFLSGRGSYVASVDVAGGARSTGWASLTCQRTYYWRIRANGATSQSAWSPTRSFYIDC